MSLPRDYNTGKITDIYDNLGNHVSITIKSIQHGATTYYVISSLAFGTKAITYTYGANERLTSVTDPEGNVKGYTYDSSNRLVSIINKRGITQVTNEYDSNGRVIRQTHADGGVFNIGYTVVGGTVTETKETRPDGSTTVYRFNNAGYMAEITDAYGQKTVNERSFGTNELKSTTDKLGRKTTYTYDENGNTTSITDPAGNVTSMEYEPVFNKPTKITDALGNITTMEYDINRRLIRTTDPKGSMTDYVYDNLDRIKEVTDGLGNSTNYTYDANGNLKSVTDAKGQTITYAYNSRDKVASMTDQLGRVETYSYNTSDDLISVTDRKGQITSYTYDKQNRITRTDYADRSYTAYTYDTVGRLSYINDSISGLIEYIYSDTGCSGGCSGGFADKVIQEVTPLGSISYTYDAIGRRTSMTVAGQPTVNYTYDVNNRLTDTNTLINGVAAGFSLRYDALGRRAGITLPNGVTTNYSYDNASRLLTLEHLNPAQQVLESLNYVYDAAGNRTSMNRQSATLPLPNPASNINYNESNQMLTFQPVTHPVKNMTYDNNGNMTSVTNDCGTTNYTWDVRNRLIDINGFDALCAALSAFFKYDALGRRIEKTVNGRTIQYLYDGLDIVQEIENGQVTVNYIRTLNIDEPLARIKADGTIRYYQQDALGSVIALTDENGNVKTTYSYDPFGNVSISGEASDNPFQYTGRENDGTGLYYYRARYYSPELQRFISEDPIGLEGGINFFAYANNNPVRFKDALGLGEGCGPAGLDIPDPWTFKGCCNTHDKCYKKAKCSDYDLGQKYKCDWNFCACVLKVCTKTGNFICTTHALTYCILVIEFGGFSIL